MVFSEPILITFYQITHDLPYLQPNEVSLQLGPSNEPVPRLLGPPNTICSRPGTYLRRSIVKGNYETPQVAEDDGIL